MENSQGSCCSMPVMPAMDCAHVELGTIARHRVLPAGTRVVIVGGGYVGSAVMQLLQDVTVNEPAPVQYEPPARTHHVVEIERLMVSDFAIIRKMEEQDWFNETVLEMARNDKELQALYHMARPEPLAYRKSSGKIPTDRPYRGYMNHRRKY